MGGLGAKKCTVFGGSSKASGVCEGFFPPPLEGMGKEISALGGDLCTWGRMHSYATVFGLADPAGLQ